MTMWLVYEKYIHRNTWRTEKFTDMEGSKQHEHFEKFCSKIKQIGYYIENLTDNTLPRENYQRWYFIVLGISQMIIFFPNYYR